MAERKILVIDDDEMIADLARLYLEGAGYHVITANNSMSGLELAGDSKPDLIVLDLMLPGIDGLQICRMLRAKSDVPIIMLTAKTTEEDKLEGFDVGADDYITKPFSPKELTARVKAVLRRGGDESLLRGHQELTLGDLYINFPRYEVVVGGKKPHLTRTEFRILATLTKEPGRVFTRAQIIDKALGHDFEGLEHTVDAHIWNLRKKIEPDPNQPRFIKTVHGVGYKLEES